MNTYVYGITAASHPAPPKGIAGVGDPARLVRTLTEGNLTAVVSDAPEGLRPKRKDLLAHQNVLTEVGTAGCVLPMRFGSVAPDDGTVTDVLAQRADHYQERLRALSDTVEYNVKAIPIEEAVLRRVVGRNSEIRDLADANRRAGGGSYEQQVRLGEMIVSAVQAQQSEDIAAATRALEPEAVAVSAGPESTDCLVNRSFLVGRNSAQAFLAAVEDVRKELSHLELRVSGPLPPYSFVELGPAEPAHRTPDSAHPGAR
ncbi:GvpL/GvpF family gas vesicle protein [Streptomyces sp. NPDC056161]|uniref:GvpL/GvpF family gas vesicle protein n=1 Tax=Streptomyces sp. NPDC056161 TaxID=3345732 RepID=UPI0035E2917F